MLYKIACIENSISAILTIRNGYLQKVTTESNKYINQLILNFLSRFLRLLVDKQLGIGLYSM